MSTYGSSVSTRRTPQSEPVPGKQQVKNRAGGYVFQIDKWQRLERFLVLGCDKGTYYAGKDVLTRENARCIEVCANEDLDRTIETIVGVSKEGRAPKNDPAIFALALLSKHREALDALPEVCRIPTHLFGFLAEVKHFRGWGRALKRAVGRWYTEKDSRQLAYLLSKYQSRNGWSNADALRLSKPKTNDVTQNRAFRWAVGKEAHIVNRIPTDALAPIYALERAKQAAQVSDIVKLIQDYKLVREGIPTAWLNEPSVWEALLQDMPMTAMIRNLGKMSSVGLLVPFSAATRIVQERLTDIERIRKARIHPIQALIALKTYSRGAGIRGSLSWKVVPTVSDALNECFMLAFKTIEPTGKNFLLGIDVSGSMSWATTCDVLTCAEGAGAMAMATVRSEPSTYCFGFCDEFVDLGITSRQGLQTTIRSIQQRNFGRTDCALPMVHALQNRLEVDVFCVYTDNETYAGRVHPYQALEEYRQKMGRDAKLVVCGMTASDFTIANPDDSGMLDVVGFDSAAPSVISNFTRD